MGSAGARFLALVAGVVAVGLAVVVLGPRLLALAAGPESEVITLTDLFVFQQTGTDPEGRPVGQFRSTGLRPMFSPKLEAMGYRLDRQMFMNR